MRNVFDLTAAQLETVRALYIKVPDGATTLINVRGGSFYNTLEGRDLRLGRRHGLRAGRQPRAERRPGGPPARDAVELPGRVLGHARPARDGLAGQRARAAGAASTLGYQHIFGSIAAESRVRHRRDRRQPAEPVPARPDAVPDAVADAHPDVDADEHRHRHADGDPDDLADTDVRHRRPSRPRSRRPRPP